MQLGLRLDCINHNISMKHIEYGLKFTVRLDGRRFVRCVDSANEAEVSELCIVLDSFDDDGWLPDITEVVINPLNDLILGKISEMHPENTLPGTTIEFTRTNVILRGGDEILQTIPTEDFKQILIEWRDFMNKPLPLLMRIFNFFRW
jgi:hypothetical protein